MLLSSLWLEIVRNDVIHTIGQRSKGEMGPAARLHRSIMLTVVSSAHITTYSTCILRSHRMGPVVNLM